MTEKLLQLEKVTKVFRRAGLGLVSEKTTRALDEISLTMYGEPTIVALVGESGSGKSTVCRLILGLEKTTSGQILYEGRDVSQWLEKDWKNYRKEVQIVFQDPYGTYNPFYRVDRVLWTVIKKFHLASTDRESRQLIDQSLEAVGLRPREILGICKVWSFSGSYGSLSSIFFTSFSCGASIADGVSLGSVVGAGSTTTMTGLGTSSRRSNSTERICSIIR